MSEVYEAYTFDYGDGVKTIHCTDHGNPSRHTNPHIHDEPGAGLTLYSSAITDRHGMRVGYFKSRPAKDAHGDGRPLTDYEWELFRAMR